MSNCRDGQPKMKEDIRFRISAKFSSSSSHIPQSLFELSLFELPAKALGLSSMACIWLKHWVEGMMHRRARRAGLEPREGEGVWGLIYAVHVLNPEQDASSAEHNRVWASGRLQTYKGDLIRRDAQVMGPRGGRPIECISSLDGMRVVRVATGMSHVVLMTAHGAVLSFGDGHYGQLGHYPRTCQETRPHLIEALSKKVAVDIAAGNLFTVVLTQDYEPATPDNKSRHVYTFGSNAYSQLGHGLTRHEAYSIREPTIVETFEGRGVARVARVAAAGEHAAALLVTGEVFTWGDADWAQLGHHPEDREVVTVVPPMDASNNDTAHGLNVVTRPTKVPGLDGVKIVSMAVGPYHTGVVDAEGYVYTWGCSEEGKLGHGSGDLYWPEGTWEAHGIRKVERLAHKRIVKFACGSEHSLAIDSEGRLHAWGRGTHGELGHNVMEFLRNQFKMPSFGCLDRPRAVLGFNPSCLPEPPRHSAKRAVVDVEGSSRHTLAKTCDGVLHLSGGLHESMNPVRDQPKSTQFPCPVECLQTEKVLHMSWTNEYMVTVLEGASAAASPAQ